MEAAVCGNFLKTIERAHASTKLTETWEQLSDIEFSEKPNEAGWDCLNQSFQNDYLHLIKKAEMARLFPPGMGFPHVLCGTVPDGNRGCSQICPLIWDWAAVRPLFLGRPSCCEYLLVPWVMQFRTLLVWLYLSDGVGIWCGRNRVRDLLRHKNFLAHSCQSQVTQFRFQPIKWLNIRFCKTSVSCTGFSA